MDGYDGSSSISTPGSKFFGEAYARKASPASVNHGNISLGKDSAKISRQIAEGKGGTEVGYVKPSSSYTYSGVEKYDRSDRKVNPIHTKINERAKKAQNECADLAILLTEAALLLNESVGVKDRSTDKVVKVFKTNEDAMEWINNNGGNDRYQLTNKLK